MTIIQLNYRELSLAIEYKTIKHTYLRVKPDGLIHITANKKIPQKQILALVDKHYPQLITHQQKPKPSLGTTKFTAVDKLNAYQIVSELLQERFSYFSALGYQLPALTIRQMKSRWGSYSRKTHRIALNLELIRYSREVIDSVVVHELCHLVHFNHSAKFYALMSQIVPNWREYHSQLRHHQTA